jgi:hypothetical protein
MIVVRFVRSIVERDAMRIIKRLLAIAGNLVVGLSFVAGFFVGAIFGETVISRCDYPTALTFYLAGERPPTVTTPPSTDDVSQAATHTRPST